MAHLAVQFLSQHDSAVLHLQNLPLFPDSSSSENCSLIKEVSFPTILAILACPVFEASYHTDKIYAMRFQANQKKTLWKFQKDTKRENWFSYFCIDVAGYLILGLIRLWTMNFVLIGEKAALQELLGGKIEYRTQNWAAG